MKKKIVKQLVCSIIASMILCGSVFAGQFDRQANDAYINEVSMQYNLEPSLVKAVIDTESCWEEQALSSSGCMGLMQISPRWHYDRMERLGVTDLNDGRQNILVGCDLLAELISNYGDVGFSLMVYNQGYKSAKQSFDTSGYSSYAQKVLGKMSEF